MTLEHAAYIVRCTALNLRDARAALDAAPTPLARRFAELDYRTARLNAKSAAYWYRAARRAERTA